MSNILVERNIQLFEHRDNQKYDEIFPLVNL